ncbi:hypothetical protein CJ178_31540 [Rhodococcus sp. ACPA4]|uniref:hypothetical protein n=1 Tax=Rhodococcus sp. ACPA4 TaxID=2028571 RepID=UPI000BB0D8F0|nr:hypothetical protein [Rhodococcus sp. ACPA4]PBC35959.1 hypothetical protein CJ178_31540 [Rhodococcus sp. ACPA4]
MGRLAVSNDGEHASPPIALRIQQLTGTNQVLLARWQRTEGPEGALNADLGQGCYVPAAIIDDATKEQASLIQLPGSASDSTRFMLG